MQSRPLTVHTRCLLLNKSLSLYLLAAFIVWQAQEITEDLCGWRKMQKDTPNLYENMLHCSWN